MVHLHPRGDDPARQFGVFAPPGPPLPYEDCHDIETGKDRRCHDERRGLQLVREPLHRPALMPARFIAGLQAFGSVSRVHRRSRDGSRNPDAHPIQATALSARTRRSEMTAL